MEGAHASARDSRRSGTQPTPTSVPIPDPARSDHPGSVPGRRRLSGERVRGMTLRLLTTLATLKRRGRSRAPRRRR
ncbi:MAG: hypothetical protein EOP16_01980 [Pseudonocardia sp.]|nr:MAG: hypothetical protein EOP16_01980 [Pseudonocardia sp.]